MSDRTPNQDALYELRKVVRALQEDVGNLVTIVNAPSKWTWLWRERGWTIPTSLIILGAFFSGSWYVFGLVVDSHIHQELKPAQDNIAQISADLSGIKATLGGIQLKQLSSNPTDPHVTAEVRKVFAAAKSANIQLSAEAITNAAARFVEASKTYPDAWNAVQEILSYRTFQNSLTVNLGPQVTASETIKTRYFLPFQNVPVTGSMRTIGASYAPDVAEIRPFSGTSLNANLSAGPSFLVLDAPNILLDGLYAKRVVFENSHIIYRGGSVGLDNVYFLNCTFEIVHAPSGQNLADAILSPQAVTDFSTEPAS